MVWTGPETPQTPGVTFPLSFATTSSVRLSLSLSSADFKQQPWRATNYQPLRTTLSFAVTKSPSFPKEPGVTSSRPFPSEFSKYPEPKPRPLKSLPTLSLRPRCPGKPTLLLHIEYKPGVTLDLGNLPIPYQPIPHQPLCSQ